MEKQQTSQREPHCRMARIHRLSEQITRLHAELNAEIAELDAASLTDLAMREQPAPIQTSAQRSTQDEVAVLQTNALRAEAALRASEERFRALFTNMTEGFALHEIIVDAQGTPVDYRFIDVNPAFERMTGLRREDLIGREVSAILPDNDACWLETYGNVAVTGEPVHFENYSSPLNRYYDVYAYRPAPRQFAVIFTEITERKRIEKAMREHTRRQRLLSSTTTKLLETDDPQAVVEELAHEVLAVLDCQAFFNYLVMPEQGRLRLNAYAGIPFEEAARIEWLDFGVAVCGCVARDGCRVVAEDIQHTRDPRTDLVKGYGIRAYACHPLLSTGGKVIGTLSFGTRTRDCFSDEDLALMKTVSDHIALAMDRQRAQAEREQLLAEIARRAADLNAVIESTDAQLALLDRDFNFLLVNSAYIEGSQHSREELIGRNHFTLFPHAENEAIFSGVRDTGIPYHVTEKPFEFIDQPDRGTTYWNWILVPMTDAAGRVERLLLSLVDVTAQVQTRQQVERLAGDAQQRAAELDAVITSMGDGLVIYNATLEILRINPVGAQILGLSPEECRLPYEERLRLLQLETPEGMPFPITATPEYRALRGEVARNVEAVLPRKDGQRVWICVSAAPLYDADGAIRAAVCTFTDVTRQHILQEHQQMLLHLVSHDLRIPMSIIHGHAELVLDHLRDQRTEGAKAPVQISLDAIRRGVQRMNVMVEDLTELARLEGGQLHLSRAPVNLASYLAQLLSRSTKALDTGRIHLEVPDDLPPVLADGHRLDRIILNLLTNALKYSDPGTPVRVRAHCEEDEVVVSVIDQGRGIHPDDLPHLFQRFYRASGVRQAEGIGLGLYITRLLVEAHGMPADAGTAKSGGRIWVDSEPGRGSVFSFTLPLACHDASSNMLCETSAQ